MVQDTGLSSRVILGSNPSRGIMSWGNIGPRRPAMSGENCLNCGMVFVMEPGYRTDDEGIRWARWTCNGCGRTEEWAVGRDPNFKPEEIKHDDIVE